ncbi:MAG TPA: metallophosphoesterase family protein [Nocardioidaceae bacterium]|nr:metallophosphoesterase family protein [Nocardioidaceae bacterium]
MGALYVVSDIHGYLDDLVSGLRDAGLVDENRAWSGGDAQLWILGDLMDRGPNGIGVLDFVRALQAEAPAQVHMLLGNHEALAVGMKRFPGSRFAESWQINGGRADDQDALTDDHLAWLSSLPAVAKIGDYLFLHSDTTDYLRWGDSVEEINAGIRAAMASDDVDAHWDVWAGLTSRYRFARLDGPEAARELLEQLGASGIVHGHSIIASLIDCPSSEVDGPVLYADNQVLAIDGGRYDGGPLLVVQLED